MNKTVKGGLLKPKEMCEYSASCKQDCNGKNPDRDYKFSCGLRRGLLIVDGYDVKYGNIV